MSDKKEIKWGHCTVSTHDNGRVTVSFTLEGLHPGVERRLQTYWWRLERIRFTEEGPALAWADRVNHEIREAIQANEMALVAMWEAEGEYLHGMD